MRGLRGRRRASALVALLCVLALVFACLLGAPGVARAEADDVAMDPYADAAQTQLADGTYLVDVTMTGGSGKASIDSPTQLVVEQGRAVATIEWSSPNYDYMLVAGKRCLPVDQEGNSTFVVPVLAFDEPFEVVGDTTAMSQPHEITYELVFDSASAVAADGGQTADGGGVSTGAVVAIGAAVASAALGFVVVMRRRQG